MTVKAPRNGSISRTTRETDIRCEIDLDGPGERSIRTGLGFLDHMLDALSTHSGVSIRIACTGDLHVDDHHTVEDVAIALGQALDAALGDRAGIARFGWAIVPLDEALSRASIDLATRAGGYVDLGLKREAIGGVACENLSHFFRSLAASGRFTIHVDVLKGENDHHRVESAFKAAALALRQAIALSGTQGVPSTKGVL